MGGFLAIGNKERELVAQELPKKQLRSQKEAEPEPEPVKNDSAKTKKAKKEAKQEARDALEKQAKQVILKKTLRLKLRTHGEC